MPSIVLLSLLFDEEDNGEEGKEVDVRVDLTDRSCEELMLCIVLVLMTG